MIIGEHTFDTNYPFYDNAKIHEDPAGLTFSDWLINMDGCENMRDLDHVYKMFWESRFYFPLIYLHYAHEHLCDLVRDFARADAQELYKKLNDLKL